MKGYSVGPYLLFPFLESSLKTELLLPFQGHALRLAQWAFWVMGITEDVKRFTEAGNVWEQDKIWREKVRPPARAAGKRRALH